MRTSMGLFATALLLAAATAPACAQSERSDIETAMTFNARLGSVTCVMMRIEKRAKQDKPAVVVGTSCINQAAAACKNFGQMQMECDQWRALAVIIQRIRSGDVETEK